MANRKKIDDELKLASEGVKTATDNLNNMSYDNFKQGSMYQGLQKDYSQQGQQAMKDTLGQVAARTGGMASSYATSAANQSYNNYMRQLEDVARAMYNDEYSKARDKVSLAQNEYNRLYGESRDALADQRYEDERAYQQGRDALADQRYNQEKRDAELERILGAEGFAWGDWDGDGKVGEEDTDGEMKDGKAITFDDLYGGSSYGEDYWKAYAQGVANDRKNTKIADEKKNGTLLNSLINNASFSLSDADQASFDEAYGDGAYEATRNMIDSTRQFMSLAIHIPAKGDRKEQGQFLTNVERAIYALSDNLPWLSSDQLFALLEKIDPEVMEIYGNADTYFGEKATIHGYDNNGRPIYSEG